MPIYSRCHEDQDSKYQGENKFWAPRFPASHLFGRKARSSIVDRDFLFAKRTTLLTYLDGERFSMHPSSNYLLVYDADCGPCRKFRGIVDFIDRYNRLDYISLREADELGLLNSIAPDQRHKSFHIVSPTGHVLSG